MNKPKTPRIIVFNNQKRCVALYHSAYAAARSLGGVVASVTSACKGSIITYKRQYFRRIPENVEVTLDDLGTLTLTEFDSLCGAEMRVWKTGRLSSERNSQWYKRDRRKQKAQEKRNRIEKLKKLRYESPNNQ